MPVVVAAANQAVRERLLGLLDGAACRAPAGLRAAALAASSAGPAVLLVDCALLGEKPGRALRALRRAGSRLAVVVFGSEEALFGPAMGACLKAGAADFLSIEQPDAALLRRLRPHLREAVNRASAPAGAGVRVDRRRRAVERVGPRGRWVPVDALTPKEYDLLCLFLEHPATALPRGTLLERVWGERTGAVNLEVVDKAVGALRRKLGKQGLRLRTVRGVGYQFD